MSRDTDLDWQGIGASEPWYGVLATEKFLKANLTAAAVEEFYQQGVREVREVVDRLRRQFGTFAPNLSVDFGCGLGRLTFAMADYSQNVIGLDISSDMLKEAERQRIARGVDNVHFQSQLHEDQRADWINSYIVFQHIAPSRGLMILDGLLQHLNLGGLISIHLTYCHDKRHVTELVRDVDAYVFDGQRMRILEQASAPTGLMSMYDYDLNSVFHLFGRYGLDESYIVQTDHGGCHGIWLFAKKHH